MSGPNHSVSNKVLNDGFINTYAVSSRFGSFRAFSTLALTKLVHELNVIAQMEKVEESSTLKNSLGESVENTAKGLKRLFTDPKGTFEKAASGLGRLFERTDEVIKSKKSQAEDNRFKQFIGFSKSKREVAAKFNVDVYSSNGALIEQLDRIAMADYLGGISLGAALIAVPGPAGIVLSTSGGARLLREVIRTTPPAELRIKNRQKLEQMGTDPNLIDLFINNAVFSPLDQTMLVMVLESMPKVKNRSLLVKVACLVQKAEVAFLVARTAALYAEYNNTVNKLRRFIPVARILYAQTAANTSLIMLPTDYVIWSQRFKEAMQYIKSKSGAAKCEIWVTGRLSPLTTKKLKSAGWKIHTQAGKRLFPKSKKQ
ncbi:MAG: hypothetical protein PVG03_16470 [Desulfarculaceae bacterium]